jgi:hypothetical protein
MENDEERIQVVPNAQSMEREEIQSPKDGEEEEPSRERFAYEQKIYDRECQVFN